ncbi:hypothetical protein BV898_00736 [Hypsibius exemplaris]|uniref:Chromo domain-containing protein n=1 Tax=Hypsibius exemplaris TaxID=2072580 RepID=A0A1W0XEN1_HYPEX|nr:hypothetical protein BV898_00736 [Hypsibius exemplaris]
MNTLAEVPPAAAAAEDLHEEHPLAIDMDEYPYVVEEIQDKRTQDDTGLIEYLVKWFGFGQEDTTWEPQQNLPLVAVKEYEEDMRELEVLARSDVPQRKGSRSRKSNKQQQPQQNSLSSKVLQSKTWQARRKQRVEELLARRLNQIKSIRLKDGTLEFLCVWDGEPLAQIVPRAVLMMKDDYKQKLLDFYEKFVVLARPTEGGDQDLSAAAALDICSNLPSA